MKAVCCSRKNGIVAVVEIPSDSTRINLPAVPHDLSAPILSTPILATNTSHSRQYRLWDEIAGLPLFLEECDLAESVGWCDFPYNVSKRHEKKSRQNET